MVDAWWMHGGLKVWQIKTVSTGHPSFGLFFQHEPRRSVSSMVSVFCGASSKWILLTLGSMVKSQDPDFLRYIYIYQSIQVLKHIKRIKTFKTQKYVRSVYFPEQVCLWNICGTYVEHMWNICGTSMPRLTRTKPTEFG